jgi:iron-sulfur cluster repair protein YtfE (RIC family)
LLADSTTPDEFIWGGNQSMRANAQNKEGIERIVDARQREAELAVDADQNWAEQGEASLVDFVGF